MGRTEYMMDLDAIELEDALENLYDYLKMLNTFYLFESVRIKNDLNKNPFDDYQDLNDEITNGGGKVTRIIKKFMEILPEIDKKYPVFKNLVINEFPDVKNKPFNTLEEFVRYLYISVYKIHWDFFENKENFISGESDGSMYIENNTGLAIDFLGNSGTLGGTAIYRLKENIFVKATKDNISDIEDLTDEYLDNDGIDFIGVNYPYDAIRDVLNEIDEELVTFVKRYYELDENWEEKSEKYPFRRTWLAYGLYRC